MFPPRRGRADHATIRLQEASEIVDALTDAAEEDLPRAEKLSLLVSRFADVIGPDLDYHVLLLGELNRAPAPRVLDRVTYGPTFSIIEPRDPEEVQTLIDFCGPICDQAIPEALAQLRTPCTFIYSEDADARWYRDVFKPRLLKPNRWADDMACYWSDSEGRVIIYNAFRSEGTQPFTPRQRDLLSLACRAIGPVMDQTFVNEIPDVLRDLEPAFYPVLLSLLQGFSRKEIARHAGVMLDYVDMAIAKLLDRFKVRSRGELAAIFVDQKIARWLEDQSSLNA